MLGEPISGTDAGLLGIATHVVPEDELAGVAAASSQLGRPDRMPRRAPFSKPGRAAVLRPRIV